MEEQKNHSEEKTGSMVCNCCGGGCSCGWGGWGGRRRGSILRILLALLIAFFVFSFGVKVGELKMAVRGFWGRGYYGQSYYGGPMPMMYQAGYYPQGTVQVTNGSAGVPVKTQ